MIREVTEGLLDCFRENGHTVLPQADTPPGAELLLTTAEFGAPVHWRESLNLTARLRFKLDHPPTVVTLLHAPPEAWQQLIDHLRKALAHEKPDPADFSLPGMAKQAYHTLYEQGRRGGPLMAIVRIIQAQAMSVRNIVVVGGDRPSHAYTFDLVGAHPRSDAADRPAFYEDLMLRILTAVSTHEITEHVLCDELIPLALWRSLDTPKAMQAAGRELGRIGFFTEMVKVANLVDVPLLDHVIASQYSEGCYATWEPVLNALVCTITGSARPVEKDNLTDDELAVITGVRPDGKGAYVQQVQDKRNDPPSSEAVEMVGMDEVLPRILLGEGWPARFEVPIARSKLHGHRGVRAYDPRFVEFVPLDPAYYFYPVSCSTEAQANAIKAAFARSEALQNPADPRPVVFTILPGHGVLIVEKWVHGKAPFQVLCEFIADGRLEVENFVPQGPMDYQLDGGGRFVQRLLYPVSSEE